MFLIDSHGKRPVCIACHRLGPYQEGEPGASICEACGQAADAHLQRLAETVPELRDHRLRRWRRGCDCERCQRRGLLFDEGLSVTARCVYAVLARYVYQGATVKIGQRRIAKLLGVHVETVNVAIHELEDREHIAIRGEGKARRLYHLSSFVFGQKHRAGVEEVISSPSRMRRFASMRRA